MRYHRPRLPPVALLVALAGGCSPATDPAPADPADPAARMTVEDVLFALPLEPRLRTVGAERTDAPVRVDTLRPHPQKTLTSAALPSLVLPPPAEVTFAIPETGPGATVRFATGAGVDAYVGETVRVRYGARWNGDVVATETREVGEAIRGKARHWTWHEVDIAGGGELVLTTEIVGAGPGNADDPDDPGAAPRDCGFGLLEVTSRTERPRVPASADRPSIVFVVIDTLRADRLGCYDYLRAHTPHLDALAERGTLFERAFAPSPWTWPSTASLLTGLAPTEHGLVDPSSSYLAAELVTIAEALQERGFTTAGFSSNPLVARDGNFDQGFETFEEYRWEPASVVVADAIRWAREMSTWRSFLYLHLTDPHGPYEPPADAVRALEENAREIDAGSRTRRQGFFPKPEFEATSRRYDGEITAVDAELGRLFAVLEELGRLDDTLVVVTSDHGEEFRDHGMLGHGKQLYEESVRVPLVVAGPGVDAGARIGERVENRFVAASLLGALGLEFETGTPQIDLFDAAARATSAERALYFATELGTWPDAGTRPLRAIDDATSLFLWAPPHDGRPEETKLFDLTRDREATLDVAAERPGAVRAMREAIESWERAGEARRPSTYGGGDAAVELLQDVGYLESDDDPR